MSTISQGSLDPVNLAKWEDAFQEPIANVRAMEKQLRGAISVNQEKLRTLVGESYRDLLDTAERIITMDESIQHVERHLAEASRNCNCRRLEKKANNLQHFKQRTALHDRQKFTFASQLAILQGCPMTISRLVHANESCLLPGKIYVMATLLLKSISSQGKIPIAETLRRQLSSLRSLLLRHFDKQLRSPNVSISALLDTMKAYSLVNSASCADVFAHFMAQRLDAVSSVIDINEPSTASVIDAFKAFQSTLQDVSEIFPQRLSEALGKVKSQALFSDSAVRSLSELNFDVHERWVSEDIRRYTRWVRHDDLDEAKVQAESRKKAEKILDVLFKSLRRALATNSDVENLVWLRKHLLSLWRSIIPRLNALGFRDSDDVGNNLRQTLNERLVEVMAAQADKLMDVGLAIRDIAKTIEIPLQTDDRTLWSPKLVSHNLSNGGTRFVSSIQALARGDDKNTVQITSIHNKWCNIITHANIAIHDLTKQEDWNPDDDIGDDDDFEAEPAARDYDQSDATHLHERQEAALTQAYKKLEQLITELVVDIDNQVHQEEHTKRAEIRATFLLRALRKIKSKVLVIDKREIVSITWFATDLEEMLGTKIAQIAMRAPLLEHSVMLQKRKWDRTMGMAKLWEGVPPMPAQPCSGVFKLFYNLVVSMNGIGADIWKRDVVQKLKELVNTQLWNDYNVVLEDLKSVFNGGRVMTNGISKAVNDLELSAGGNSTTNADESTPNPASNGIDSMYMEGEEVETSADVDDPSSITTSSTLKYIHYQRALQTLFDFYYIDNVLRIKCSFDDMKGSKNERVLAWEYEQLLKEKVEISFSDEEKERISKSASEYWRRTCLLFGLLDG